MKMLATTKHVDLFERPDKIHEKYTYELDLKDDDGFVRGFIFYKNLDEAYRSAAEYIRRLDEWH